jgi:hypothetical protein
MKQGKKRDWPECCLVAQVGDLRVLRLPGSINRKEGLERPCPVTGVSGEVLMW